MKIDTKPSGKRIDLTDKQRAAIVRITRKENWFHSYTQEEFSVCANHVAQQWKRVFRDGKVEAMK